MSDLLLQIDGGVFECDEEFSLTTGLESAITLTIAGGNTADAGTPADELNQWWGNRLEQNQNRHVRSRFDTRVAGSAIGSALLRDARNLINLDVGQLQNSGELTDFEQQISIPSPDRINVSITTETDTFFVEI